MNILKENFCEFGVKGLRVLKSAEATTSTALAAWLVTSQNSRCIYLIRDLNPLIVNIITSAAATKRSSEFQKQRKREGINLLIFSKHLIVERTVEIK